jgi:probable HAF family extracellular repeat protein
VGWVDGGSSSQAFRTKPNSPIAVQDYLGSLGGSYTSAKAINDAGQVTGQSDITGNSVSDVFRTKPNASINPATDDLGGLQGSQWNEPFDINSEGDVVGWSYLTSINSTHGFVAFGDANVMYDLNDLVDNRGNWVFDLAEGINDQGLIVARATLNGTGFDHAFLLTPVPEPTVSMLLPTALLLFRRTRRKFR